MVCVEIKLHAPTPPTRQTQVMVGIDQIGLELEQPFQLLPMNSLAAALTRDVCDECVH